MKYKKVINYLWKHRVQIEFIENNLLETFFFVLVCFLLYKLATKFFKIEKKKKKLFDSFFTIIFFILILSIFITQAIILELNQRKFSQLEYEIRIKNRKIKELKKKLNKWYDWMKKLKHTRVLKKLEYLICFIQVLIQVWLAVYFTMMAEDAGSHEDVRIIIFISYFGLNALLFLINGILSFLEELTRDRLYG